MLPTPDDPAYWIISISFWLLGLIISLLLAHAPRSPSVRLLVRLIAKEFR